jgi:hypothetical protein
VIFMWSWALYLVELVDAYYVTPMLYYCKLRRHLVSWCEGDSVRIMCVFWLMSLWIVGVCWNHLVRSQW